MSPRSLRNNLKYVPIRGNNIGYIGWLGYDNLGDEALYEAMLALFAGHRVLPYKNTKETRCLENLFRKRLYKAVCLGGGTLINTRLSLIELRTAQERYKKTFTFGSGVQAPSFYKE